MQEKLASKERQDGLNAGSESESWSGKNKNENEYFTVKVGDCAFVLECWEVTE